MKVKRRSKWIAHVNGSVLANDYHFFPAKSINSVDSNRIFIVVLMEPNDLRFTGESKTPAISKTVVKNKEDLSYLLYIKFDYNVGIETVIDDKLKGT